MEADEIPDYPDPCSGPCEFDEFGECWWCGVEISSQQFFDQMKECK